MQQSIDYRQRARVLWKSAQKWDRELGKAFGNTGHMRKEGGDPLDYAYGLIGRIAIVSAAIICVGIIACSMIVLNLPMLFIHAGSIALGLCLYLGAQTLYPGKPGFAMAFIVFIGEAVIAGMAASLTGHAPIVTARVVTEVALPIAMGFLVATELLSFIGRSIAGAFFYEPDITFRKLRLAGLMSREEIRAIKHYPRWLLPAYCLSLMLPLAGVLRMASKVDSPEAMDGLLAIIIITSLPVIGLAIWIGQKEDGFLRAAVDRLGGEAAVRARLGLPE